MAALSHLLEEHTDEHSAPFVPALTELVGKLQDLEREPVYTVMAGYEQALGAVPFEAAVPHGCTTLRWISRDSSKYAPPQTALQHLHMKQSSPDHCLFPLSLR